MELYSYSVTYLLDIDEFALDRYIDDNYEQWTDIISEQFDFQDGTFIEWDAYSVVYELKADEIKHLDKLEARIRDREAYIKNLIKEYEED